MSFPTLEYETKLWEKGFLVIGIDEVGRGAFAGPLFAAGVVFDPKSDIKKLLSYGINDSKKLSGKKRELLDVIIRKTALDYNICKIDVAEINRIGIGKATFRAMRAIVKNLKKDSNYFVLVDGFYIKNLKGIGRANQKGIVGGDSISLSIAAASIIAKVARDKYMKEVASEYSEFGWEENKGYGTLLHRQALARFGATPLHRIDFIDNFV